MNLYHNYHSFVGDRAKHILVPDHLLLVQLINVGENLGNVYTLLVGILPGKYTYNVYYLQIESKNNKK